LYALRFNLGPDECIGTWKSRDGLIHTAYAWGTACGHLEYRRRVHNSNRDERVVTCLECASDLLANND
jgi:predicted SprT family Zn-dependent metalloprotease